MFLHVSFDVFYVFANTFPAVSFLKTIPGKCSLKHHGSCLQIIVRSGHLHGVWDAGWMPSSYVTVPEFKSLLHP